MPFVSVPNTGQSLGATRDQIRNNILDIKNSLAVNHEDLDNGADTGKHTMTNFLQISAVGEKPTTSATEVALYNDDSVTGQIWLCPPNTTQGDLAVQLTTGDVTNADFAAATNGWTFLPGNLIYQYGFKVAVNGNLTVTYPLPFPTAVYSVQITTVTDNNTTIRSQILNPSGLANFVISHSDSSHLTGFYWMAIGR